MGVRLRRAAWIGCLLGISSAAHAVAPPQAPRLAADTLTALPAAQAGKPLRVQPRLRYGERNAPFAWSTFVAQRGGTWHAAWDAATGVPNRIWGTGMWVPGSVGNADVAERFARQLLADHIALLAPGSRADDFELVANRLDGDMRTLGFVQRAGGRRVIGGQVSFRFKNDRMFVIGSEALPDVKANVPFAKLDPSACHEKAKGHLRSALALPDAPVEPLGEEVIVPLVADDAVVGYRVARTTTIDGGLEGRYLAYVDVSSGDALAVKQLNHYATGTVLYNTVDRYALAGRGHIARPATRAHLTINGASVTSTMTGGVTWAPDADASVQTAVTGDLVEVVNKATGNVLATATLGLTPGNALVWDATAVEEQDAQINAFIATGIVKEYIRNNLDPTLPTLDEPMTVNVNINQSCNAFWDGKAINFFHSSTSCQNTALIQDVVFHEYGHHLHGNEIIKGVGDFDSGMSEGAADFLAATITGDHGMGRGFNYNDAPLRDLDPPDTEATWPDYVGEVHRTGQIFGGVFWDLRKQLIADLGETAGIALTLKLYVGALRRSINIPTSLIEVLAEDDDDGNLDNGTPHECAIRGAYARHGLRTASGTIVAPGQVDQPTLAIGVHIQVTGLSQRCNIDEVTGAHLDWLSYKLSPTSGSVEATAAGDNTYFAQLPLVPQDAIYYKARVHFADGTTLTLADNRADPYYQLYNGPVVKLYCTDFETTDPFSEGWTAGTDDSDTNQWQWGTPTGGPSDPHAAFSGSKILALALDGNYLPKQHTWLKSPVIPTGQYSDVRLQYRRWLTVEDGHFDGAEITANGKKAWNNFNSDQGDASVTHHVDREWRFHDVPLSGYFSGHSVQVGWDLTSDEGLEMGGWQLDDVCIVANPNSICGDGVKSSYEQCDNGADNKDAADLCRTDCRLPTCGDGIVDKAEACDDGPNSPRCDDHCNIVDDGGGCCSASGGEASGLLLAGSVGVVLLRRRRRA